MFIDLVELEIIAGRGGDGLACFLREKHISQGGPSGGDGGRGGHIIFKASNNVYDLSQFRFKKLIKAPAGSPGGNQRKKGAFGQDVMIEIPVGTIITDSATQKALADLKTKRPANDYGARG